MKAKVRQRSLNEPNLYDKEIFRSIDNSNHEAEREWRLLRLESLLFLRAHGGSETIGAGRAGAPDRQRTGVRPRLSGPAREMSALPGAAPEL